MSEKHMVKRAVIMAAGIGKRLQPLTFEIPKPLVKVNGIRMIDTVIQGLRMNGIIEIYVVVGYLKEQFSSLLVQYPGLSLIENPYYDTCNNISSLYMAREKLEECIILDEDQFIYDSSVLSPQFTLSGYNAVWVDGETDEWLMTVRDGIVQSCSRTGGSCGWKLYSISRWTKEDGCRLRGHVETEFWDKKNRQIYWDDVVMFCYPKEYNLGIRVMKPSDVMEIDGLDELAAVDPSYKNIVKQQGEKVNEQQKSSI